MADIAMDVSEINGEESNDLKINGGEYQSDEVKNVGDHSKDSDDVVMSENVIHELNKPDEATDSPIKLRLERSPGGPVPELNETEDESEDLTPAPSENINGQSHMHQISGDTNTTPTVKSLKRKASRSPILSDEEEELTGFDIATDLPESPAIQMYKLVDKLSQDILAAEKQNKPRTGRQPAKRMNMLIASPAHSTETPSRPSSGLSFRSDGSSIEPSRSAAESPSTLSSRGMSNRKANVELSNPLYRVPFERGWKRELVYRAQQDPHSKRQGDIYYYAPSGKKLRSTREVSEHLTDSDLTIENFTFFKEPLGLDDPEKEIIRDAKPVRLSRGDSASESSLSAPVNSVNSLIREGKRTPKPKGPKGASPERGMSPKAKTLKVKSLGSRLSLGTPIKESPLAANTNTPKAARKSLNSTPANTWKQKNVQAPHLVFQNTPEADSNYYTGLPRFPSAHANYVISPAGSISPKGGSEPCSVRCREAPGEVPSLQCGLCLCLYHDKCVGQQPKRVQGVRYVCKNCHMTNAVQISPPPPLTHVSAMKPSQNLTPPALQPAPRPTPQPRLVPVLSRVPIRTSKGKMVTVPTLKSIVGSVTTWLPPSSTIRMTNKQSQGATADTFDSNNITRILQGIAILNGRKYVVVPKHNVMSVSSGFTGQNSTLTPMQAENAPNVAESGDKAADGPTATTGKVQQNVFAAKCDSVAKTEIKERDESSKAEGKVVVVEKVVDSVEDMEESENFLKRDSTDVDEAASPAMSAAKKAKTDTPAPKELAKKQTVTPKVMQKPNKSENNTPVGKRGRPGKAADNEQKDHFAEFYTESRQRGYNSVVQIFQYLKMRELSAAARVCRLWRDIAATPALWTSVRMKNSQVNNWQGLALALKRHGTRHLDLRKMLLPTQVPDQVWDEFTQHIASVDSLLRIDLCRCPASVVERVCSGLPRLQALTASSIRCVELDPSPLGNLTQLQELRIKGMTGLDLTSSLKCLENLTKLKHLSLTSVKDLGNCGCESVGSLTSLESLELGECSLEGGQGTKLLSKLVGLCRLRLEKSPAEEDTPALIFAAAALPKLTHLELINFDIRSGFEKALGECKNVKRLLIIPTYVSQSATTNRCVLDGVLRLKNTLTHLVWGVTIELLRVTELFIVQCDKTPAGSKPKTTPKKNGNGMGDCIPVLKPVPGLLAEDGSVSAETPNTGGPPQVEILPLTSLQRLLTGELPTTRLKILRIPYHATWRQALNDND